MILKIASKYRATPIKHLSKNNCTIIDKKNMADLLTKTFSQKFFESKQQTKIYNNQTKHRKVQIKLPIKNLENYNSLFSLGELRWYKSIS